MKYEKCWLNYQPQEDYIDRDYLCSIYTNHDDVIVNTAIKELINAALELFNIESSVKRTNKEEAEKCIILDMKPELGKESFHIEGSKQSIRINAGDPNGMLYGAFELIRWIRLGKRIDTIDHKHTPEIPLRMLNHWDNMDGSIERGYSGESFFFQDNKILVNDRTIMYAKLLASIGINATVINNVNVKDMATYLITDKYTDQLAKMATIYASYGIRLFLSLNYAAPIELGELTTADPLDETVKVWWAAKMKEVFTRIPNLGGFLIKADSEGRPGPFTYGRTHGDGANMLADAVKPYGGIIIWRCFVYNCQQDWRDKKTDRARSGYDNFMPLDGTFHDNVILQIKNGPMDFQVREPVLPLFGGLKKTNQMLEVQIAQEYTGQQRHVCYLLPMFKQILEFHTHMDNTKDTVLDIISGKAFNQKNCGIAAVANTGDDSNWTGHDLAAANLYGFGKLAFYPTMTAEEIAKEWITLTYGTDELIQTVLSDILMKSWPTYEKYNAPLGIGWMVNPHYHYGPNVDGYEYDRWGTYHRADHKGIGVDRSTNGTGYASLYNEPLASMYNKLETCPDELILFFHHVPYDYVLKSGKTILQHIYDTHFEGVIEVEEMIENLKTLASKLPEDVYKRMRERFDEQLSSSKEWRDQINTYFFRKTGIPDDKGRVIY